MESKKAAVIGAGPAGGFSAYLLAKRKCLNALALERFK